MVPRFISSPVIRRISPAIYYEGEHLYFAGKVRAGLTPQMREHIFHRLAPSTLRVCPFVNLPNSTGRSRWGEGVTAEDMDTLRWVKPAVVVEVAFTEWTRGGNLRHAAFVGLREASAGREGHLWVVSRLAEIIRRLRSRSRRVSNPSGKPRLAWRRSPAGRRKGARKQQSATGHSLQLLRHDRAAMPSRKATSGFSRVIAR